MELSDSVSQHPWYTSSLSAELGRRLQPCDCERSIGIAFLFLFNCSIYCISFCDGIRWRKMAQSSKIYTHPTDYHVEFPNLDLLTLLFGK